MTSPGSLVSGWRILGFPLIVRPAAQGSSLGVRFAASREDVPEALVAALSYDDRVLLERYVPGRELAASLLDGDALPIVEVRPKEEVPGLTDTSLFPMAADAAGIAFEELVSRILELALDQGRVNRLRPNEWKEIRG